MLRYTAAGYFGSADSNRKEFSGVKRAGDYSDVKRVKKCPGTNGKSYHKPIIAPDAPFRQV